MTQERAALISALEWYDSAGVDHTADSEPNNRFAEKTAEPSPETLETPVAPATSSKAMVSGHKAVIEQARQAAMACATLDDLKTAIQDFDGLSVKKTATQIVFADGNPQARIMVVGEAPGADEDRQGKPFVGVSGRLLDKIFACIGLARDEKDPDKALYISNILNWRPPGNRTPTREEMDIALPFIERHIALINPSYLVLCGGVAAKTLLDTDQAISRLRGQFCDYVPVTPDIGKGLDVSAPIPVLATYHPSFLLRTPIQKKKVWEDMLLFDERLSKKS